ncbi:MAG: DUF5017 domain-containing protein [Bacteroidaceae bacterium]
MNKKIGILLLTIISTLTACNTDKIEDLKFNVEPQALNIKAGESANFNFSGNPDYIVFYSGEKGYNYAMKDSTDRKIEKMALNFDTKITYYGSTPKECLDDALKVYVSTDFDGDYTKEGIERAKQKNSFTPLTFALPNQSTKNNTTIKSGELDFETYKTFFIAFKYEFHVATSYKEFSTALFVINNFFLESKVQGEDEPIIKKSPRSDFGFTLIPIVGPDKKDKNGNVYNESGVQMRVETDKLHLRAGTKVRDTEYWIVSKPISTSSVEKLTKGIPVKGFSTAVNSFNYKYEKPGTYTATFVARNANAWNSSETIKEFTITVE